ncbi:MULTISPECIES: hypothetical protein [Streptomyces]|nr:hypothetical protein [Streptomyces sp. GMR22]MBA6434327.1 hypothetical protein [Streptomyces sp. GMR22]
MYAAGQIGCWSGVMGRFRFLLMAWWVVPFEHTGADSLSLPPAAMSSG